MKVTREGYLPFTKPVGFMEFPPMFTKFISFFEKHKQDVAKSTDKYSKGLTQEGKINVRKGTSKVLGKISNILKRGQ